MTTNLLQPASNTRPPWWQAARIVVEALAVWQLARTGFWPLAVLVVVVFELGRPAFEPSWTLLREAAQPLILGFAAVTMAALFPKAVTVAASAALYLAARLYLAYWTKAEHELMRTLVIQALAFEAIFLAAAIAQAPSFVILVAVWVCAYGGVYPLLAHRNDRAAGLLAAAWALIAAEVAWVMMGWLVSYIVLGSYLIVPQATIVLSVLGYCFGSIYLAQRQNQLGRRRLAEYLLIGLVIIIIVIAGTPWKGSI